MRTSSIWLWTICGFGLALVGWTVASPVGASPDEPAHMTYAWGLVTGQGPGPDEACAVEDRCPVSRYEVPTGLIPQPSCYAFDPAVTVECQTFTQSPARTAATRYPPPYYVWTGLAMRAGIGVGADAGTAGLIGRLSSALLAATLIVPAFVLGARRRPGLAAAVPIVLTPMAYFLSSSVNPNGVEIAGAVAVAVAISARRTSTDWFADALFSWGAFWLAWSRPIGWLWLGLVAFFGLALFIARRRDEFTLAQSIRNLKVPIAATAVSGTTAAMWFLYAIQARATSSETGVTMPENGTGRVIAIILRVGDMSTESIGRLGWLDTPIPTLLRLFVTFAIFGSAVLATAAIGSKLERRLCFATLLATLATVVLIMERQSFLWQGRYVLPPLVAVLIFLVGSADDRHDASLIRLAAATWLVMPLSAAWLYARYAFGIVRGPRFRVPNLGIDAQWTPSGGSTLLVGLLVGAIVVGLGMLTTVGRTTQALVGYEPAPEDEATSDETIS